MKDGLDLGRVSGIGMENGWVDTVGRGGGGMRKGSVKGKLRT